MNTSKTPDSDRWQLIEFQANARVLTWSQAFMKQQAYTIAFNTNDLYMACHAARQKNRHLRYYLSF